MQIIHLMTIDMAKPLPVVPVSAVQGDGNTRAVKISLLENGSPWEVPAGVTAAVAFRKSDGTKGLYDTLPDGTKAVTIESNAVSAVLAPQVLSCAGSVSAAVVFYDGTLQQLATFPFTIRVEKNPAAGQEISNDYYRYSTMEAVSDAVDAALASLETAKQDFLTRAEEALSVVHDTATADAPAIVCESAGGIIRVSDSSGRPLKGLTLCGKTTQSGTPTPENPVPLVSVGAGGVVTATVAGKNLVDASKFTDKTDKGITFTKVAFGGVHVSGTSTGYANTSALLTLPKGRYVVSGVNSVLGVAYVYAQLAFADGTSKTIHAGNVVEIDGTETGVRCYVQVNPSATVDTILYPMLEAGETVTAFEPYKEIQTLTASTVGGLPGIPVESGGNYTDENGQQWVCDEIDFDRGVYAQRVLIQDFSDSTIDDTSYAAVTRYQKYIGIRLLGSADNLAMCSHLDRTYYGFHDADRKHYYASNAGTLAVYLPKEVQVDTSALKIAVCLETPIETALSAGELAAYAALHTGKPNTTVFNDVGAGMKLAYVADTKTYIDQKLAAISKAILS